MMSAWPACWAVSAMMCRSTRRTDQLAPGSNHGASGSGWGDVEVGEFGGHLVGAPRDLVVALEHSGERFPAQQLATCLISPPRQTTSSPEAAYRGFEAIAGSVPDVADTQQSAVRSPLAQAAAFFG